ncbi:hypothetical protein ASG31_12075 [Chryseobacterium sp. Leaf404]|nr:hypothetical protein ASG31_12075 [Chryseobacterium sp. Leaf404]
MQPKIKTNAFLIIKKTFLKQNKMKHLQNIPNQYSTLKGLEPKGILMLCHDHELVEKRCLYTWVS